MYTWHGPESLLYIGQHKRRGTKPVLGYLQKQNIIVVLPLEMIVCVGLRANQPVHGPDVAVLGGGGRDGGEWLDAKLAWLHRAPQSGRPNFPPPYPGGHP